MERKAKVAGDRGGPATRSLQLRWKFERIARACKPDRQDHRDRESRRLRRNRRGAFNIFTSGPRAADHQRNNARALARLGGRCNCLEKKKNESMKPIGPLRRPVSPAFPRLRAADDQIYSEWNVAPHRRVRTFVECECVIFEIPSLFRNILMK